MPLWSGTIRKLLLAVGALVAVRAGLERERLHRLIRRYGIRSDDFRKRDHE